jgi:excisionase family DNA binding protein
MFKENHVNDDRLMTLDEVAHYLGVPKGTLYAWRTRSVGPIAIRVGKHLRFRRSSVEDFLRAQTDRREQAEEQPRT